MRERRAEEDAAASLVNRLTQRLTPRPLFLLRRSAPECVGGAPPSAASDVYSVAFVLFSLFSGSMPFHQQVEVMARAAAVAQQRLFHMPWSHRLHCSELAHLLLRLLPFPAAQGMESLLHTVAHFGLRPNFPEHTPVAIREVLMARRKLPPGPLPPAAPGPPALTRPALASPAGRVGAQPAAPPEYRGGGADARGRHRDR